MWCAQRQALSSVANVSVANNAEYDNISKSAQAILDKAPDTFSVAGLSFGGFLVFELLKQAPERIERVVLMNTNANAADQEFEVPLCEKLIQRAQTEGIENIAKEFIPYFVTESSRGRRDICDKIVGMAKQVGAEAYIKQTRASLSRPDSRPGLTEIRSPVLVIGAREDVLTPPHQQEELAEQIPVARLEILEQCGHMSTLEKPEEVSKLIRDWVDY